MPRVVLAIVVQTALVLLLALLVLGAWLRISGRPVDVVTESPRLLFFFMDIGLGVWLLLLVVLAVRRRALPGVAVTLLAAVAGVVLNALTVLVVGVVQGESFLDYAIEAGLAFLVAVLVAAPIIHRLFRPVVKPPREVAPPA
ncbi:hypothetical protein [Pseudolysinimonas sp.]|jgi:hypothetical protein|uniref:hypothetical protein n=1 Tax=Pseudolysinimonas sp. TaxID=2680009 RepID=UPI003783D308